MECSSLSIWQIFVCFFIFFPGGFSEKFQCYLSTIVNHCGSQFAMELNNTSPLDTSLWMFCTCTWTMIYLRTQPNVHSESTIDHILFFSFSPPRRYFCTYFCSQKKNQNFTALRFDWNWEKFKIHSTFRITNYSKLFWTGFPFSH